MDYLIWRYEGKREKPRSKYWTHFDVFVELHIARAKGENNDLISKVDRLVEENKYLVKIARLMNVSI